MQKNLRELSGLPLITRAIRKCVAVGLFDEIWVNSEHPQFGEIAAAEGVNFHLRPVELGNEKATSEQYIAEFLEKHPCECLVQVHSIAPLLTAREVEQFVMALDSGDYDCLLSVELIQIECAYRDNPINFSYAEKTNSQDLDPVQRVCWSISAWRRETFLAAVATGKCATYSGRIGYHPVSRLAGHVIKTEEDLKIAEALLPLVSDY